MENFSFFAPAYFAFGKGEESKAGELVKRFGGTKVFLHYGGFVPLKQKDVEAIYRLML